jgi:hypothetical protein
MLKYLPTDVILVALVDILEVPKIFNLNYKDFSIHPVRKLRCLPRAKL